MKSIPSSRLGPPHGVRSVGSRIEPDSLNPTSDDPRFCRVDTRGELRSRLENK